MPKLLFGKPIVEQIEQQLHQKLSRLTFKPKLVIVQVGYNQESTTYIKHKKIFGEKLGVEVDHQRFEVGISKEVFVSEIESLNKNPEVTGIIIQLPIPEHLSTSDVLDAIAPEKDVDGLTSKSISRLFANEFGFVPAATQAVLYLLDYNNINVTGKKVVIVGHSQLVGKPTALALMNRNATITVCHIHTRNLEEETKQADIIVTATGKAHLIARNHVSPGQIVIDIGISVVPESEQEKIGKKIVGDVDFEAVKDIVEAITPVPGGVGPVTVACLFENLIQACSAHNA